MYPPQSQQPYQQQQNYNGPPSSNPYQSNMSHDLRYPNLPPQQQLNQGLPAQNQYPSQPQSQFNQQQVNQFSNAPPSSVYNQQSGGGLISPTPPTNSVPPPVQPYQQKLEQLNQYQQQNMPPQQEIKSFPRYPNLPSQQIQQQPPPSTQQQQQQPQQNQFNGSMHPPGPPSQAGNFQPTPPQLGSNLNSPPSNSATSNPYLQQQTNQYQPSMPPPVSNLRYPNLPSQQQTQQQYGGMPPPPVGGFQQPPPPQGPPPLGGNMGSPPNTPLHNMPPQPQYHQQTQQKLDPDAMPSVVQVIEDDKQKYFTGNNVIYSTSVPSTVPPLVTSLKLDGSTIIQDNGCARPNHIRSSIYHVPFNEEILKTTTIPFGLVIKPFDESEVEGHFNLPITKSEILRCNRCKAYMSPFMRFVDGGRRFQCRLCNHVTEVPANYYSHLDHNGLRLDKYERPELYLGSYEFQATAEYCKNSILNCRRPHIIFAFELSKNSRPIIEQIGKLLPDVIRNHMPRDPMRPGSPSPLVGFMTYNSKIQMYDIKNNGHAYIICDVNNTFPPLTSFLVDPDEYADQIESFLSSLCSLSFVDELETETILGPVIEAAFQTCQVDNSNWFKPEVENENLNPNSTNTNSTNPPKDTNPKDAFPCGKIYIFHSTLPTYGQDGITPGRLKPRWTTSQDEIRKLLGTDKEKQILTPESTKYYNNLAQKCVTDYGSGVELFLFPPMNGSFLDIATLSELVRLTGTGALYKYYNDPSDSFISDLKYSLRSSFAFEATMKVRTSAGLRPFEYIGNYFARTTADIELSVINAGCNIGVELKYDDKLPEDDFAVIQVATLYTSLSGERRVRIHNLALNVCQQVSDVYKYACCDTLVNILLRQAVYSLRAGEKTITQIKESLVNRVVSILAAYRKHCSQPNSSLGQLILPEALKLLPMYMTGALKCDAIDGGSEMMLDDKAFAQIKTLGADIALTQVILYPKLLKLNYDENDDTNLQATHIRCASYRLVDGLAYLLDNGFYMFLYIPALTNPNQSKFLKNIFGVDNVQQIQPENGLPQLLTAESQYLNNLIEDINFERRRVQKLFIIRQGMDKLEPVFKSFLYEDTKLHSGYGPDGKSDVSSYVDLLCHLHKQIRTQLN